MIDKIIEDIKNGLETSVFNKNKDIKFDMGDIGNEIGFAIAKHFSDEVGFTKEEFLSGISHGISLVDGTHDKK